MKTSRTIVHDDALVGELSDRPTHDKFTLLATLQKPVPIFPDKLLRPVPAPPLRVTGSRSADTN